MAVPRICPSPSRMDLNIEIRTLKLQTIAATNPPPSKASSPTNHAEPAARLTTTICLTQIMRLVKSATIREKKRFMWQVYCVRIYYERSSDKSCSTRFLMSSRITRTDSIPWPAGSSSTQSSYRLPG